MTLRAQAEKTAEEMAMGRCDTCGWQHPLPTGFRLEHLPPGVGVGEGEVKNHGIVNVSAGLDSDPLREAPSLPWHKRLRVALSVDVLSLFGRRG